MKHIKLIALSLSLVAVLTLAFSQISAAQSIRTGDKVAVSSGEVVDSLVFMGGTSIDVAGTVNGDLYCAGQTVTITGTINGDVICAAQTITISGKVQGSVRLAGQAIVLGGSVNGSATVASQSLLVQKTAFIQRDLVGGTQSMTIDGIIARDVALGSENATINGQIGRNVTGEIESLTVGTSGQIAGDLRYSSNNSPVIDVGGKVVGTVTRTPFENDRTTRKYSPAAFDFSSFLYVFVTMLIVALVLTLLFPNVLRRTSLRAIHSPGRIVLTGIIGVIVVPVIIFALMISVIGLPLGILIMLVWFIIMFVSGPVVGFLLGRLILKKEQRPIILMLLGASILLLAYFIPILGFFVMLAAFVFGVGMLLDEVIRRRIEPETIAPKKVLAK